MRLLPGGAAATDRPTNVGRSESPESAPRPAAKPIPMRRDLREAVTLFWRSLARDLLQGGENSVLMLSATGNEGEAEVAHLTARLAIQEGFRSILVRTISRVPGRSGTPRPSRIPIPESCGCKARSSRSSQAERSTRTCSTSS